MSGQVAVYRTFDAGGLLYVGSSIDPAERLKNHKYTSRWYSLMTEYRVEWHPDRETATVAEAIAIHTEHPRFNIRRPVWVYGRSIRALLAATP